MEGRPACSTCAKVKRKCGRQMPSCDRCRERDLICDYPPPRPSDFILLGHCDSRPTPTVASYQAYQPMNKTTNIAITAPDVPLAADYGTTQSHTTSMGLLHCEFPSPTSLRWFLAPETFKVEHPAYRVAATFPITMMKRYSETPHKWLERWVKTGSCPFIHPILYRFRFPACVQLAYTTLSTYLDSNENTKDIILRIVEDRVAELLLSANENNSGAVAGVLEDESIPVGTSSSSTGQQQQTGTSFSQLDSFDQLARVHALTVYQYIGLYDGDIRARHLAEGRIHILNRWVGQMLDMASAKLYYPLSSSPTILDPLQHPVHGTGLTATQAPSSAVTPPTGNTTVATSVSISPLDRVQAVWHTWILVESIRRTWLVTTGMQTVYLMLQQTWSPCPGGIMFTTRQGVWDAPSAFAWEKLCQEGDVGFVQRFHTERFFGEKRPAEVDEFCLGAMESAFGAERMERWRG